jgi:GTP diphosphokinase / guanosine-3',5'-bis(diphosphate) 3'-diphosphatase
MAVDQPSFTRGSPLLRGAWRMAHEWHHGPRRRGDTDIDHPVAVAGLLHEQGFDEGVVAAGLLHDVVEDTTTSADEIAVRYGPEVARLVGEMTEDPAIEPYEERKAEHRDRVSKDRSVAAIYAADKLATTRSLDGPPEPPRLEHYVATFRVLCETHPDLPFLDELRAELERIAG